MIEFAANLSLMFCERPLLARFGAARAAGFRKVEVQFPYTESPEAVRRAASDAGVDVVLINAPVIPDCPFGLAALTDRSAEFRAGLDLLVDYAGTLGVRHVNVLAGQAGEASRAECRRVLVGNLLLAAERLEPLGAGVVLEPINAHDVPGYFVQDVGLAREIVEEGAGRAGLLFDVYHCARMGLSPLDELARSRHVVRHVQFADVPGRHEPGTGTLDFEPLWRSLHATGYDGVVAAEYRPSGRTEASLSWLPRWRDLTAPR